MLSSWKDGPRHHSPPKYPHPLPPMSRELTYFKKGESLVCAADLTVTLNGRLVTDVTEASAIEGWVLCHTENNEGRKIIATLHGVVRIVVG